MENISVAGFPACCCDWFAQYLFHCALFCIPAFLLCAQTYPQKWLDPWESLKNGPSSALPHLHQHLGTHYNIMMITPTKALYQPSSSPFVDFCLPCEMKRWKIDRNIFIIIFLEMLLLPFYLVVTVKWWWRKSELIYIWLSIQTPLFCWYCTTALSLIHTKTNWIAVWHEPMLLNKSLGK